MTKKELRKRAKDTASALPRSYRDSASDAIAYALLADPDYITAKSVFIYISVGSEPATGAIVGDALKRGKTVAVPKTFPDGEMSAVIISAASDLLPGAYGIPEPQGNCRCLQPEDIELAVIPCVCASPDCVRLGHGAGYYDRFLTRSRAARVCLCFDRLIIPEIPSEDHDVKMNRVITEKRIYETT